MSKGAVTDTFFWVLILAWGGVSIYFGFIGNGDMFQRMGAAGVAIVVAYYAFVPQVFPFPYGLNERLSGIAKHSKRQSDVLYISLRQGGAACEALRQEFERRGTAVPRLLHEFSESFRRSLETETSKHLTLDEVNELLEVNLAAANEADTQVKRYLGKREFSQAILIVFATLQWGFGDLFFIMGAL